MPTPPSARELAILRRVLGAAQVDGVERLLDQLRMLQVAPGSDTTTRIYLIPPGAPRAGFSREGRAKLPVRVPVRSRQGRVIGDVSVVVEDGLLRALQYVRHDAQPSLMLPDAGMLELPAPPAPQPDLPAAIRTLAARQAIDGLLMVEPEAVEPATPTREVQVTASPRRVSRMLAALAFGALLLLLAAAGLWAGRSGAADLDAARAAGTADGARDGAAQGDAAGTFAGSIEGDLAGRNATYGPAFTATRARVLKSEQAAALERARAKAAATQLPNPSSCVGYWADVTWVCSA